MTRTIPLVRAILTLGSTLMLALSAIACSDAAPVTPVNTPEYVDLFACNVSLSCPMYCSHLGVEVCSGGGQPICAGDLWIAGTAGAIMLQDRPGPGTWMGDELTLLLGDGTALVQKRSRSCFDAEPGCSIANLPWELGPHELCTVKTPPMDCVTGNCPQLPSVENCVPVDKDWTCADAMSAIAPMP